MTGSDRLTSKASATTLVDVLRERASRDPDRRAYVFLQDGEAEAGELTWAGLDLRARAIAAALQGSLRTGDRVLLLFPPGLDFVAAFFGCLYAGTVAVPAYPPRSARTLPRLRAVLADCGPAVALTSSESLPRLQSWFAADPGIAPVPWLATDGLDPGLAEDWRDPGIGPEALAFLQYTSGSTGTPKGVMVSHGNLLHNQELIRQACDHSAESVFVSWLPVYHDLGLIGQVLQATYVGAPCILMAPVAFLQRPMRWLEAVSRYRATTSGGPNFAWDLCARKAEGADLSGLDLSSWRVAFNGAEPVRAETLERFAAAFAGCGFRAEAAYPCYGLAEATLMVSGGRPDEPPVIADLRAADLEAGRAERAGRPEGASRLVGCGRPLGDQTVAVVDPQGRERLAPGAVGEVWVSGSSVARGYWNRPQETEETFGSRLADGEGPFLRTGDLGFLLDGELYIAGRIKDLILLRGRNLYPQDIERTVEASHPALRAGGTAAFSVDSGGEERLVVVQEVERRARSADPARIEEVAAAVRGAVAEQHEAYVWDVVLVDPGGVPRTTSGKVQRRGCRNLYLEGALPVVGRSTLEALPDEPPAAPVEGIEPWLRRTFARLARVDPALVDPDRPLAAYGLDSLVAIELRNAVEAAFGVEVSFAELLEGTTLRELAGRTSPPGLLSHLPPAHTPGEGERIRDGSEESGHVAPDGSPLSRSVEGRWERGPGGEVPLSWGQRGLWFLHRLAPESAAYNIAGAARLPGGADAERLRRALQGLVDRHEALRATFSDGPDRPVQQIAESREVAFLREDASGWSAEELRRRLAEEAFRPFDLESGPVFRAALFERAGEAFFVLAVHHAAADLASMAVLVRELGALYAGSPLPEPGATWTAYVRHEERFLAGPEGERLWERWRDHLAGAPELDLPTDRPRPPMPAWRGTAATARLDAARLEEVRSLARAHGSTLFMTLLAAFQALLARTTGQDDFLVGSPTSGRDAERWTGVVGYFIHPVALRADLAGDPSGSELLARARREALACFELAGFPFALLAERLRPEKGSGRPEPLQAMLALQKSPVPELEALAAFALGESGARLDLGGLTLESTALPIVAVQRDLTLLAAELGGGLSLSLQVDAGLFDAATAARMLGHFTSLLAALAAGPERRVSELAMLSGEERAQVLAEAHGTAAEISDEPVHRLVAGWAEREPDRLAVAAPDGELTYAELHARARRLARRLRTLGVGPESLVAVCAERSAALVAGVLGVLEAGAAYVPLDPSYPGERLGFVLEEIAAAGDAPPVIVVQEGLRGNLPEDLDSARVIPLSPPEAPEPERGEDAGPPGDFRHLAYVIYTSGSTGRPKGVQIPHAGLSNLVSWHRRAYGLGPADRATLIASPGFDASVWEVWPCLASGASLHVPPEEVRASPARLAPWLAAEGITIGFLPTPLAEAVLEEPWPEGAALRILLTGGDKLHRPPRPGLPFRLVNHYGPTESTVVATCVEVPPAAPGDGAGAPPIGHPIDNLRAVLLGRHGELVPPGVPGELCVGGDGLARGYLRSPDLTAGLFVPDPFGPPGARLYRTGDLARRRPEGDLEFLGRLDGQVKVRGVRIETGEVEAALSRHPAVREAAVLASEGSAGGRLVAYVAAVSPLPAADLKAFLRRTLPEAMIPAAFVPLSELPHTPHGKVDRRALARIEPGPAAGGEPSSAAPRTPAEELIATVWADLLGLEQVGIHESFFELGGHSLLAARMIARLRGPLGVELPLAALFESPTVAGLAAAFERTRDTSRMAAAPEEAPLVPVPRDGDLPLSYPQERLWFLDRLAPGGAVYNIPAGLRLRGPLDSAALARALAGIACRHEALRATFPAVDGRPVQRIAPGGDLPLPWIDLSGLEPEVREAEALRGALAEARRAFDLAAAPPVRAALIRLVGDDHILLLTLHHIAADGWSMGVLLREFEAFYTSLPLPVLPFQYADWAAWERRRMEGEILAQRLGFWRGLLAGALAALDMPTDRPRPAMQAFRGAVEPAALSCELDRGLRELAHREEATLFLTLLAGFAVVLHRWSGQEDVVIGCPVDHRGHAGAEDLIGLFVNTLPLRVELEGDPTFRELLARVRGMALAAFAHQDVPFERLVEELEPRRDLSRSPLFQAMLAFQSEPARAPRLPGIAAEPLPPHLLHTGTAKFDLTLSLEPGGGGLSGGLEIDTDLFAVATARRLLGHFERLLAAAAADPGLRISELPLLTAAEVRQVLEEHNATAAPFPRRTGLHELFLEQAGRTPEATALIGGAERISYGELRERAGSLARRLRRLGVAPEVRVGVFSRRTPDLIAGLLAVLEAGGAYVPLDPGYPAERVAFLLEDSGAPVLLAQEDLLPLLPPYTGEVVVLGQDRSEGVAPVDLPRGWIDPDQLAYVIYTSGSTGRPKGVGIRHSSAAARIAWALSTYPADRLARVLAATSVCFDLSVFEIFVPLAAGGAVVLAENALELPDLPAADEVTLVNTVPSAMAELARADALPPSVRVVNLAGEPLRRELADRILERQTRSEIEIWNLYGPSEDTTYSTGARIVRGDRRPPAIGRPLANSRVYLLDARLRPVPVGVPGEIWIGGAGVARGYLGRPDLTAERFRPDPFTAGDGAGERLYRTGDLGRRRPDGEIDFLGRLDHQVKVRGFRIEPGEIEAALLAHPDLADVVVMARERGGDLRLVAWVEASPGRSPDAAGLRDWLAARLPAHMVPASWVVLPELPRTPNGKVDRAALPEPPEEPGGVGEIGEAGDGAPRTPVEELLAGLWAELLGRDRVGVHDDFFALGGHSLLAVRAMSRLRDLLGFDMPLRAIFVAPTVAALAQRIEEVRRMRWPTVPPLAATGAARGPLSLAQERLWFFERLDPGSPLYNLPAPVRLRGPLDPAALEGALRGTVRRHGALRTTFAEADGEPVQVVGPIPDLPIPIVDLRALPPASRQDEAARRIAAEARLPFDLARAPLLRASLLRLDDEDWALLLHLHHLIADGWSIELLLREMGSLYGGREVREPPLQYVDFALWQRRWLREEALAPSTAFWKEALAGAPTVLELPADRPRPAVQSYRGAVETLALPSALAARTTALARTGGATRFMTLLAAFQALLLRLTPQDDVLVGTPVAGRDRAELAGVVGLFVNTLVLRAADGGGSSFRELLARVRRTALAAYAHQDLPFERLVQELGVERSLSHTPLIQALFDFQSAPLEAVELPGLEISPLAVHSGVAKLDLTLALREQGDGLAASLEYGTDLFDAATARRLLTGFRTLVAAAAEDPDRPLADLPLIPEEERREALLAGTGPALPAREPLLLPDLLAARAALAPESLVIEGPDGERWTWAALDLFAERLARRLRELGVGPEVPVGVCLPRSPELVAALLAVWKAGGAYLPLDPAHPRERLALLIGDSGAPVVVTSDRWVPQLPADVRTVLVDDGESWGPGPGTGDRRRLHPESLAYVLYTSGSTGRPKGVAVAHGPAAAHLRSVAEMVGLGPEDRALQFAAPGFDVSLEEMLPALISGATLVQRGEDLWEPATFLDQAAARGLTNVNLPTAYWQQWVRVSAALPSPPPPPPCLRRVCSGGEGMPADAARLWWRTPLAGIPLDNGYGPTEVVVTATFQRVDSAAAEDAAGHARYIPIGRILPGRIARVLDRHGQLLPQGIPGELCLGGVLARGYHGRPDLTAERFVPDPFAADESGWPGVRLYRTGDRVRLRPDGSLDFLGRVDQQVKVRGVRIEPGEIEAALRRQAGVREAVVVAVTRGGDTALAACVVPADPGGGPPLTAAGLRAALAGELPAAMVPATFLFLEALPLTAQRKVDRRALARLAGEAAPEPASPAAAPRTPVEELLAGLWAGLLGRERVGIHDGFFDLGGHSLLATRLVSRVREAFGVEIGLRSVFEAPTVAGLACRIEEARRAGTAGEAPPLLPGERGSGPPPLSFAQERLWFLDRLEPGSAAYNVPLLLELAGPLAPGALAGALGEITRRHEVLRSVFAMLATSDGGPVQVALPPAGVPLPVVDLGALRDEARRAEASRVAREEASRPFDLEEGPLFRALLVRLAGEEHRLHLTVHHAVFDGGSAEVLVRELAALLPAALAGSPSPLPGLTVQYADFAAWQRRWLAGEALESRLSAWKELLAGAPATLDLPTDLSRPAVASPQGAVKAFALDDEPATGVRELARRSGATLFMTLLAAFQALLHRYTGQDDLVVGSPVANRDRAEIEDLVGLFVNTLPLRGDLSGDPGFADLLARVRREAIASYALRDLPFEKLVEELAPQRDLSRTPLFQVFFLLHTDPGLPAELAPGLRLRPAEVAGGAAKFDLKLGFAESPEGLAGGFEYRTDLFEAVTVRRMAGHLRALLGAVTSAPEARLSDLSLLSEEERRQLLGAWSLPEGTTDRQLVHERFEVWAERTPDALAVAGEDEALSYRELDERANRLARRLRNLGVGPDVRVAVCLERSATLVTALLGVLKAGGAYVPFDPDLPAGRLADLLADCGAAALIAGEDVPAGGLPRLLPRLFQSVPEGEESPGHPGRPADPRSLAYVIYTSGSTGRPKGVMVEHRQLAAYVDGVLERMGLPDGASYATVSTFAADLGHTVVFPSLATGGALRVPSRSRLTDPDRLAAYLGEHPVDCLKIVPSHLAALLTGERPERVLPRRLLVLGGEAAPWPLVDRIGESAPECRVLNHYGPTETTVGVLTFPTWEGGGRRAVRVPPGGPLPGVRAAVVDARLRPVLPGVPGELLVGGPQVSRGYLGRPDLTAERFVPDPFGGRGERLYRTGDRVRTLPDNTFEFLGRVDQQVKIRGFRVEPGEVESALRAHPAVREAVVAARPSRSGELRLVAWVVPDPGHAWEEPWERGRPARPPIGLIQEDADSAPSSPEAMTGRAGRPRSQDLAPALRAWLRERLPEAMVPSAIVPLAALPLTANGKVDRKALPDPGEEAGAADAPRTPAEEVVAALYGELLGTGRVGRDDGFFDLGGHSLLAMRLLSRVRRVFGATIEVRAVFESPTVAGLAARIEEELRSGRDSPAPPLTPQPRPAAGAPLSFAQERLWFLAQLEPASAAYNVPRAFLLRGALHPEAMAAALDGIVRRHEALRTVFPTVGGGPVQRVEPHARGPLPVADLGSLPEPVREAEVRRLIREEARRPFDLRSGPVLRARLARLGAGEHLLLLSVHHIASDAWSFGVFLRELGELYAACAVGRPPRLPEPPVQYADFALWQRSWLQGETLERLLAPWRARLAGAPAALELPTDRPHPPAQGFRGGHLPFRLAEPVAAGLRDLARNEGSTMFMVLLAAFQELLHRYSGQEDVVVGSPTAGRNRPELEGLIGLFLNTLALRGDLSGAPSFRELLARAREVTLEAYAFQDLPFERLVEELQPVRDAARSPLFQVMLVLQNAPLGPVELPGLTLSPLPVDSSTAKLELLLSLAESEGRLEGELEHDADLFDRTTVERLLGHFAALLAGAAAGPDRRLSELPMLSEAEGHQLRVDWNDTAADLPEACLHHLFEAQAVRSPGAVAAVRGGERWTYRDLDRRAGRLARRLRRLGVGPEVTVAVCLDRGLDLLAALLGVLKAGGAYVPLDPAYPRERLDFMLADSRAAVLLGAEARIAELAPALPALALDREWPGGDGEDDGPRPPQDPRHLAYVIYTSGSTGRPKGVGIEHRSASALVSWAYRTFGPRELAGVLAATSVCFDLSVFELFAPLATGGSVILAENALELPHLVAAEEVTLINTVPSAVAELVREGSLPASVRTVNLAGEPLKGALVRRIYERSAAERVWNLYGPSEDTTYSTALSVPRGLDREPGIGRPLPGTRARVLDASQREVPPGVPGELCLAGAGLARGYLGRPELTAERFVPDPFGGVGSGGERLYRTGDLVRHRPDGSLDFLGRIDHQVKVRGFRIELGEVEAALESHPALREAVAVVREEGEDRRLVAYVVPQEGSSVPAGELREHLRTRLPEPMLPSVFVALERLPRTPNGKVDRKTLPAPEAPSRLAYEPPRNGTEETLAGLWSEILGVERVGIHDSFFDLGGHSILGVRLLSRVRELFGVELRIRVLFQDPTVAGMAAAIGDALLEEAGEDDLAALWEELAEEATAGTTHGGSERQEE